MRFDDRRTPGARGTGGGRREGRSGGRDAQNFGSSRSDYGDNAYGGRLNDEGRQEERGWLDGATDAMSSWFGDEGSDRGGGGRADEQRRGRRDQYQDRDRNYGRRNFADQPTAGNYGRDDRTDYLDMAATEYTNERGWNDLRASDVMTSDVVTVNPDNTVQYAAHMMAERDCGAIPVVDWQGRMIGMITDRDITVRLVARHPDLTHARVAHCMTKKAFACHVNDSLQACMNAMARHQIRRMPIVDDRNQVVGIVSQGDIAHYASEHRGQGGRRIVGDIVGAISEPSEGSYS